MLTPSSRAFGDAVKSYVMSTRHSVVGVSGGYERFSSATTFSDVYMHSHR